MSQIANTAAADYHARRSRSGLESAPKTQNQEDRATRHVSNKAIFTTSASADVQKKKKKALIRLYGLRTCLHDIWLQKRISALQIQI